VTRLLCAAGMLAVALIIVGCGGKSEEERAGDILVSEGGAKERVSELAQKGLPHLKKLLESTSSRTRLVAISALGELKGNQEATNILVGITKGKEPTDTYFAAIALAHQGASEAKTVIETLFKHNDPYLRQGACCAIGEYGDKALYPLLDEALDDPDPSVRTAAENIMNRFQINR